MRDGLTLAQLVEDDLPLSSIGAIACRRLLLHDHGDCILRRFLPLVDLLLESCNRSLDVCRVCSVVSSEQIDILEGRLVNCAPRGNLVGKIAHDLHRLHGSCKRHSNQNTDESVVK